MAQIKLLRGVNVTTKPDSPAIKDGQVLFATGDKAIYIDVGSTRTKIAVNPDTALKDITDKLAGLTEATVVDEIAAEIAKLKKLVVAEAAAGNNGVTVSVADNADSSAKKLTVSAKLSGKTGNALTIETGAGEEGLYVPTPAAADTYTVKKADTADTGFSATYQLYKVASGGTETAVGEKINIAKDFLVKSASIETVTTADSPYTGAAVGDKYIDFVINTKEGTDTAEHLYLAVNELVDVYKTGSAAGDMIVIAISNDNKITATITDGTVTKAKLETAVQTSLGLADTAVQPTKLAKPVVANEYISGIEVAGDGTIDIKKATLPSLDALEWGSFGSVTP